MKELKIRPNFSLLTTESECILGQKMPEANIVKFLKAKVKHVDDSKRTELRWPFPLPALEVVLFPGQIFVDLGTHKRTKKK